MAGVSMKDIKLRIKSMESTKQITKAMEMVAASKLRRAQERIVNSRPYFAILFDTLNTIANDTEQFSSPFLEKREIRKSCYVVIGGDRGLAGGYNSNVLKLAYSQMEGTDACVIPIGKKCLEFFRSRKVEILTDMPVCPKSGNFPFCHIHPGFLQAFCSELLHRSDHCINHSFVMFTSLSA